MYFSKVTPNPALNATSIAPVIAVHAYSVHKLLWDLFQGEQKRDFLFREELADEQMAEKTPVKGLPVFYVVSRRPPASNVLFQTETKAYAPHLASGDILNFRIRANPTVTRAGKRHDLIMDSQYQFLRRLCDGLNLTEETVLRTRADYKRAVLSANPDQLRCCLSEQINDTAQEGLQHDRTAGIREVLDTALSINADIAVQRWFEKAGQRLGFELINVQDSFSVSRYEKHVLPEKGASAEYRSVDVAGELQVSDPTLFVSQCLYAGMGRAKAFGCGLMLVKR